MQLVARGIGLTFGTQRVLRGIDLLVRAGESLAILGPSGSGKTTLLSVLGGMRLASEGTVHVEHDSSPREAADAVAWVHQVPAKLGSRSACDNVALGAIAAGRSRRTADLSARLLLGQLGMASRADTAACRLSGGELQRVAIGRALASDAPFVLADEPTGQLDGSTTVDVCGLLIDVGVRELGRGLVMVTHDASVASRCDRSVYLVGGELDA